MFDVSNDLIELELITSSSVDGAWGVWSEWGICSATCDDGIQRRDRECNHPPPMNGGQNCTGNGTETLLCNLRACPGN